MRRIVTKRTTAGGGLIHSVDELSIKKWPGADAGDAVVWSTSKVPTDNSDRDLNEDRKVGMTIDKGSVFRVTELGPGFRTPMHRTLSIDYGVVLAGTLDMILDRGVKVRLNPGDVLVQRGTLHAWHNPSSDSRCRFAVSMIEALPVTIGDEPLRATPMWKSILESLSLMMKPKKTENLEAPMSTETRWETDGLRYVVTGVDDSGLAGMLSDGVLAPPSMETREAVDHIIWGTTSVPASNAIASDRGAAGAFDSGTRFSLLDLDVSGQTSMAHSNTTDYCVVISGKTELALDGGQCVSLTPADVLVQRGTKHTWRNLSSEKRCRVLICAIGANPACG